MEGGNPSQQRQRRGQYNMRFIRRPRIISMLTRSVIQLTLSPTCRAMQPSSDQQREKGTPPPPPVSDAAAGTGAPSPVASSTPAKPGSKVGE